MRAHLATTKGLNLLDWEHQPAILSNRLPSHFWGSALEKECRVNGGGTNMDVKQNSRTFVSGTIKDTVTNALMVDGHCETFAYDPCKAPKDPKVSNFKQRDLCVNRL